MVVYSDQGGSSAEIKKKIKKIRLSEKKQKKVLNKNVTRKQTTWSTHQSTINYVM